MRVMPGSSPKRQSRATNSVETSLVWFQLDLRLADNPALHAAVRRGGPVVPVFIYAPDEEAPWPPGAASRWWLHQSLRSLDAHLRRLGSRLIIRRGPALEALELLTKETGATAVFWNRRYEPAVSKRANWIESALINRGLQVESFNGGLLHEPWTIQNQSGRPFQVFTPFWRYCLAQPAPPTPLATPKHLPAPRPWPKSLPLAELQLEPKINWSAGLRAAWQPGGAGAKSNLARFLKRAFNDYSEQRNLPGTPGTSRLSPHLHFGEISPRQVWHGVATMAKRRGLAENGWRHSQFLTELGWREFAHHLLFHFPRTPTEPLRAGFNRFPWRRNSTWLKAWQKGRTGHPIVDAGMRELWATGWMHNRVRMITASFLVKDLLISWHIGARWFWDTLVDADVAQNTLGWQWVAGCGADAAPYFRVFNPVRQGEKFDPRGEYVRHWCPELAKLPDRWLHEPWRAPKDVLSAADVELGRNYPRPIVNHIIAREVALEAFAKCKKTVA
jgi:deoxyribodipyrimidine photo-lyase